MKEKDQELSVDVSLVLGYIAIKDLQSTERKKSYCINTTRIFKHRHGKDLRHQPGGNSNLKIQSEERILTMAQKAPRSESETSPEILMLGFLFIKGADSINEKVSILDRFALADADIATICNCADQSVRNAQAAKIQNEINNNQGAHDAKALASQP